MRNIVLARLPLLIFLGTVIGLSDYAVASDQPSPKIIGGQEAAPGAFPSIAALLIASQPNTFLAQFCAGTLIHPLWVMTAGHCVDDIQPSQLPQLQVQIGRNDLPQDSGDRIDVAEIVLHPEYFNTNGMLLNDIALLKLAKPSSNQPISVPPFFDNFAPPGTLATAVGWGTTSFPSSSFPDVLQQVDLPIVSNELCNLLHGGSITDAMVCAGFPEGGKDTCVGDSGGPLLVSDAHNNMKQVGITSFGIGCALPFFPGVYTRVANFSLFISNTVCSDAEEPPAPEATVTVEGNTVTGSWNEVPGGAAYQVFYAPLPEMAPIRSMDLGSSTSIMVSVPSGLSFAAAVVARNGVCYDPINKLSNIVSFTVP